MNYVETCETPRHTRQPPSESLQGEGLDSHPPMAPRINCHIRFNHCVPEQTCCFTWPHSGSWAASCFMRPQAGWNSFFLSTLCETNCLKSLVLFPLLPHQCTVDCGMWNGVECKVWSVKKVGRWVGNVVCRVWSRDCEVWSAKCKMESVKCQVWSVKCRVSSVECTV